MKLPYALPPLLYQVDYRSFYNSSNKRIIKYLTL
nr:MAG TPA: hypothetical protein [Caudoviricetes sp.]DAP35482.1 MAG TPA: hypothetical protein [Caudoviricetes sp.]DAU90982.1 MAG TPA: hypothetical protein [Caudoviricetes sp.]